MAEGILWFYILLNLGVCVLNISWLAQQKAEEIFIEKE